MAGSSTFVAEGFVARTREQLDDMAASVEMMEAAQRLVIAKLVGLWPSAGWRLAGCRTPKIWLRTYTCQSDREAARLESIARLCSRNELLADAVTSGRLRLGWAEQLARVVTDERAPHLTDEFVQALLDQIDDGITEETFEGILRWFKDRVDEELAPRNLQPHTLVTSQSLFGGGEMHAHLSPVAYAALTAALDAFRSNPDPQTGPIQRSFGERSADALEDLARYGLAHEGCHEDVDNDPTDTLDGMCDRDEVDEFFDLIDDDDLDDVDEDELRLRALRRRLQNQELQPRRRDQRVVQPRSGVRVDLIVDPYTASGERPIDDLDGFVMQGAGWNLTKSALEQFLCDSAIVTTAMSNGRILDANADAEQFTPRQRSAIAARDRHCVFPGCNRPPKHCDAHHLRHREHDGPSIVDNGCLLCRYHHRLIHQGWSLHQAEDGRWIATDPHGHAWKVPRPSDPDAP